MCEGVMQLLFHYLWTYFSIFLFPEQDKEDFDTTSRVGNVPSLI